MRKAPLSLVIARTSGASRGDCLKLVGQDVSHIDVLNERYCRYRKLFLSSNRVVKLKNVAQFSKVEMVSLANNLVSDLSQILHLQGCPKLRVLNLSGCPVTSYPFYRFHCLRLLPELTSLDSHRVTTCERAMVAPTLERESSLLSLMLANFCLILKLKETCRRIR